MSSFRQANYSIGDRDAPLEADPTCDVVRMDPRVGDRCEVSPFAGGDLRGKGGIVGKITGVVHRLGHLVGYEIEIDNSRYLAAMKDVYVGRQILTETCPPTASSAAIRETMAFWNQQRTYWGGAIEGVELFCFELASSVHAATIVTHARGWEFHIPDHNGGQTIVSCMVVQHDNHWTMTTAVYPDRSPIQKVPLVIEDHWRRTFLWTTQIVTGMRQYGFQWERPYQALVQRAQITATTLTEILSRSLDHVLAARGRLEGTKIVAPLVSIGASQVRLQPGTVGLTEPPTDRRLYTVMSISPAAIKKGAEYLSQVILHECVHVVVASRGGDPHGDEFEALAEEAGLEEKHRS